MVSFTQKNYPLREKLTSPYASLNNLADLLGIQDIDGSTSDDRAEERPVDPGNLEERGPVSTPYGLIGRLGWSSDT